MSKRLKIINRAGITLYDSAQTVGVDYKDKDNKYDDHKEESKDKNKNEELDMPGLRHS